MDDNDGISALTDECKIEHFNDEYKFLYDNAINILQLNIQSIREKIDDLEILIQQIEEKNKKIIHIIALSEIWIFEEENQFYNIDRYNAFFSNRSGNRSGGVIIYIHETLNAIQIENFKLDLTNFLLLKLTDCDINIGCIYKYEGTNIHNFNEKLEEKMLINNTVIVGDINIKLNSNDNTSYAYKECLHSNGFMCLNSTSDEHFTRKGINSVSHIDHVVTDKLNNNFALSYVTTALSDHRTILTNIDLCKKKIKKRQQKNIYKIFDYESFDKSKKIYEICKADNFQIFHEMLRTEIEKYTKIVEKKDIKKRKSWVNETMLELIEKRDYYYKLKQKNMTNHLHNEMFKKYKTKVRNIRNYLKKNHFEQEIEENINCNRKIWKVIKNAMYNRDEKIMKTEISKLVHNDTQITSKNEIAETMNEYFVNVVQTSDNFDLPQEVPIENIYPFSLDQCSEDEIEKIIMKLNVKSSNGYDGVSVRFLNKYCKQLAKPLNEFFNECMRTGVFPNELKIGAVVPILKKGNNQSCSNYRPITKLSSIDKILEEILLTRLKKFLNQNVFHLFIDSNQFGFVENSNTLAACVSCIESIHEAIDKKKYTALISIDLQKAFDSVNLKCLVKKLHDLGIKGNDLKIFEDFLNERKQYVEINDVKSTFKDIKVGIPQGSKLAGTLFITFINGVLKLKLKGTARFYADDGSFKYEADSIKQLINDIKHDVNVLLDWFNKNQLQLNINKTKILIFNNHTDIPTLNDLPGIEYNGQTIERVEHMNYLGLIIDDKLNWNEHVLKLKKKIIPITFALKKLGRVLPKKQLWMIYHSYILSHINYMNPIWNNCSNTKLNEIQRIQNRAIKNIENKYRLTPTVSLYNTKPNIRSYSFIQTVMLIHKIKHKQIKSDIHFNVIKNTHNFFLRNINNFRTRFFNTERGKKSLSSKGMKLYNSIPEEIKNIVNPRTFKIKLTQYVIENKIEMRD